MSDIQEAQVVTPQKPEEVFVNEYNELCKKHGFQISVVPTWVPRDDGSFSTVLRTGVSKLDVK